VRHGETDWNAQARVQGFSDVPLNQLGREQARRAAAGLANEPVAAVYASDLSRAKETAAILAAPHALPVVEVPALRERSWGSWEGRTLDELSVEDPENLARLRAGQWVTPDGAEEYEALVLRISGAVESIAQAHVDQTVIVTTHGGPIKVLTAWILGAPVGAHSAMRIGNASLTTVIVRNGRFVLESYNVPPPGALPEPPNPGKTLIESAF